MNSFSRNTLVPSQSSEISEVRHTFLVLLIALLLNRPLFLAAENSDNGTLLADTIPVVTVGPPPWEIAAEAGLSIPFMPLSSCSILVPPGSASGASQAESFETRFVRGGVIFEPDPISGPSTQSFESKAESNPLSSAESEVLSIVQSSSFLPLTDLSDSQRDELTQGGWTPLQLLGDFWPDGSIDGFDVESIGMRLQSLDSMSLCEQLSADVNEDGRFDPQDMESLRVLSQMRLFAPGAGGVLRPLRGHAERCPVFPIAFKRAGERIAFRRLSEGLTLSATLISWSGERELLEIQAESDDSQMYELGDDRQSEETIRLSVNGVVFLLSLPLLEPETASSLPGQGEGVLEHFFAQVIPHGVVTAPNLEGESTVWSIGDPDWQRIPPPSVIPVPPPQETSACKTDANGRRIGAALILQYLSDWRLNREENLANQLESDHFSLIKAATAANYKVFSHNLARDPRMRPEPQRWVLCWGDLENGKFRMALLNGSYGFEHGQQCVVNKPEARFIGRVFLETKPLREQLEHVVNWRRDQAEIYREIALLTQRYLSEIRGSIGGAFIFIGAHGSPARFQNGLPVSYGRWHDGVGMYSVDRIALLSEARTAARTSCNFTFVDLSCYAATALYARYNASSCKDRPARWVPIDERERQEIVNNWLTVGHPWRLAWAPEAHGRVLELLEALKHTSEARLNRSLRTPPRSTGNFGDAYYDRGYNDPIECH